jgi:hypothetical protein
MILKASILLVLVATVSCARLPHSRHVLEVSTANDKAMCELKCYKAYTKQVMECMRASGTANVNFMEPDWACTGTKAACEDRDARQSWYWYEHKPHGDMVTFGAAEVKCHKAYSPQRATCWEKCT